MSAYRNDNNGMLRPGTSNSNITNAFADWNRDPYTQAPRYLQPTNSYSSASYSQNTYGDVMASLNRQPVTSRGNTKQPQQNCQHCTTTKMLPIKFVPVDPEPVNNPSALIDSLQPIKLELSKNQKKKERQKRNKVKKEQTQKVLHPGQVLVNHEDFWTDSSGRTTDASKPSTSAENSTQKADSPDDYWGDVEKVSTDEEILNCPRVPSTSSHDNWGSPGKSDLGNSSIDSDTVRTYQALVNHPQEQEYFYLAPRGSFPGCVGPILREEPAPIPQQTVEPELRKESDPLLDEAFEKLNLQSTPSSSTVKPAESPKKQPPEPVVQPLAPQKAPIPISLAPKRHPLTPQQSIDAIAPRTIQSTGSTEKSPWSTPIPIRHNLPPAAGPGSLWSLEGCIARDRSSLGVTEVKKKQKAVDPILFARLRQQEEQRNIFTPFYGEKKERNNVQRCLRSYRFSDCISFAAMSHTWNSNYAGNLPELPRANGLVIPLPDGIPDEDTIFAYYRVLAERDNKYILIACHVNMHGLHRGDLRFLEVNTRTELEGFPGKNVIGNLFLGDIVAVTELARKSKDRFANMDIDVSRVTQDAQCYWMVSKMQLFPRYQTCPVTFTFLKNRMAVVKGDDEPMRVMVEDWSTVKPDLIYIGVCFKPEKLEFNFTEDYAKSKKAMVTFRASKISSYPNAFGMIYGYKECTDQNEHFAIGIDAFSNPNLTIEQREKIVETCSLMGFSAANTILNGRFDCRAFQMMDIMKSNLTVKFRIENPPAQPTLGLWNAGNRIVFGGPEGDVNASIETVIQEKEASLRITARLSRDIPKGFDFRNGEYYVSQREVTDHYFLYDGYFQDMEHGSNGRRIIETLYGGKPLELVTFPFVREYAQQYYFPSVPEAVALNQYQNEYVQMLLDGNPLIIGSSPFGCGKSMTIITAALEIYKRNCQIDQLVNQRQQLLITQSNYASVNLIEIAKRICSSGDMSLKNLRFVRFVTEKNWNELPDNCRTEYDMPYLMNRVFCEWATGRIDESDRRFKRLQKCHFNHMLMYIFKNQLLKPYELGGGGRKAYDRLGELKTPFTGVTTEAFFLLYQPDLIMTTADSSKNLLTVLKEVCTVQIDEASQLPEYTLLGLLKTFSYANFGLIGDIHQLPPYCEDTLDGKLKEFGIGNTMERAIKWNLFPTSTLRFVYRCHPKTTKMLSELFYDGNLLSGVCEEQRNDFMLRRSDFWPNPYFPFMIVNNEGSSYKMGTSVGNESEKELIGKMIQNLLHHPKHAVKPRDIGVISFYAAQTSVLTEHLRGSGVKCGTVDAFQGTEKEIIIVCCTNEYVSEFMQLSNRLNVAMSRAKQATIIIGNVEGLRKARYWSTIVQKVEEHRNLVQAKSWKPPPSYVPLNVTAAHTARVYPSYQQAKSKRTSRQKVSPENYKENRMNMVNTVPNPFYQGALQGKWDENAFSYRSQKWHN